MDETEFNRRVFEFLKGHLEFDYDFGHDCKVIQLKLKDPESEERVHIGYVEITEGERRREW